MNLESKPVEIIDLKEVLFQFHLVFPSKLKEHFTSGWI